MSSLKLFSIMVLCSFSDCRSVYQENDVVHTHDIVQDEDHSDLADDFSSPHEYTGPGPLPSYSYEYRVNSPHTGDIKSQQEERVGDVVRGSYSLIEADGRKRVVEYTADDVHGFNAIVKHLPADGVHAFPDTSHHYPAQEIPQFHQGHHTPEFSPTVSPIPISVTATSPSYSSTPSLALDHPAPQLTPLSSPTPDYHLDLKGREHLIYYLPQGYYYNHQRKPMFNAHHYHPLMRLANWGY